MAFPLPDDGELIPLDEVFAFVDAVDPPSTTPHQRADAAARQVSSASPDTTCLDSMQQEPETVAVMPRPKKKRDRQAYSTRRGRMKRAEIDELRGVVALLEERLEALKRIRSGPPALVNLVGALGSNNLGTGWEQCATEQARERQRAELTNRRLKRIFGSQARVNKSLTGLLNAHAASKVRTC